MDYSHLTKEEVIDNIKNNKIKLKNLTDELKDNYDIVLEAISKNGKYLFDASKRLKDDKEIVLEAVKQNGWALIYASDRLKDNKDFMLEIININGLYLQFASNRLRNDKELLEILERESVDLVPGHLLNWYNERMDFLNSIRNRRKRVNRKIYY